MIRNIGYREPIELAGLSLRLFLKGGGNFILMLQVVA